MADSPSQANGAVRWRPVLPTALVVVAVVIAVGAVTALIALLYRETRGPGEILREFARAVDAGDCSASYELLDASVHASVGEEEWCERLPGVDRELDADFDLQEATLSGDEALVTIRSGDAGPEARWRLARHGERSWRVLGPGSGFGS